MAKILIIDDDDSNREILKMRLNAAGYAVLEAGNGEDGIKAAIDSVPDLIITDVMMPKVDGWAVCRTLKADTRTVKIPVIMLTARGEDMSELRGWESGASEYMSKPCDHHKLLEIVAKLLAKT